MANTSKETQDKVRASVSSIYSGLLEKRQAEKEAKEEAKRKEKEEEEARKKESGEKDVTKLSKKERRQRELDNWKEVVIGLTGDDLEYSDEKKKKKKYKKWIDDDATVSNLDQKPKKAKKKNYNKEFQAELNMLKSLLADQNRFTNEIQKRLQIMMGPNTKDAGPLNKTEVELASAVISSRSNSLGYLREIGAIKKTIADLYLRQKKQDYDMGGGGGSSLESSDLALLGSSIAASKFGDSAPIGGSALSPDNPYSPNYSAQQPIPNSGSQYTPTPNTSIPLSAVGTQQPSSIPGVSIEVFDPSTWNGEGTDVEVDSYTKFEGVPKEVVFEWDKANDKGRFKAINTATGEELVGCPVPTVDPKRLTINEKDGFVKGEFDETYKLSLI